MNSSGNKLVSRGTDRVNGSFLERMLLSPFNELWQRPRGQIPALDALRTCAVVFVIGGHSVAPYYQFGGEVNWFANLPMVRSGWVGVDLFFVLSGYFIGRQLWRELQKSGSIHFGRFFIRRGLRIWPLYFCTFAWVAIVLGRLNWSTGRGWTDLVFLTNYINQGIVQGGWSLCTEEQFYIVAPLLIFLLAPWLKAVENHRIYLWGLLVLVPLVRMALWCSLTTDLTQHDQLAWKYHIYEPFHTHCDGLIAGLVIANLEVTDGAKYRRGFWASGYAVALALAVCLGLRWLHREILYFSGLAIFFGVICWYLLSARRPWLSFLDSWWFYLVSRLSFGMYLNHFYFLDPLTRLSLLFLPGSKDAPSLHHALTVVIIAVTSALIATVTFCLVEYPFLRFRDRALAAMKRQPAVSPSPALAADSR
jgi:peptidoglycan/LPS O-acetylase OafA/YrhL